MKTTDGLFIVESVDFSNSYELKSPSMDSSQVMVNPPLSKTTDVMFMGCGLDCVLSTVRTMGSLSVVFSLVS